MPGILPMKVIKVGSGAQPRIAQACDRCRSKKIRCDGIRPSCTQCSNVGFECKTSDKLSRRAFPRGYTESLEERVRALEQEVRELKDLLDEKDEKIDMLSRIRSGSSQSFPSPKQTINTTPTPSSATEQAERSSLEENDVFKVTQSPILVNEEQPNTYYMGTSSGRTLICALKRKLQELGKTSTVIDVNAFFNSKSKAQEFTDPSILAHPPAVMLSDRLVQIFFQEFAPLFPIIHRPTFLKIYHEFLSSSDVIHDNKSIAQLYLVFGIAALSNQSGAVSSEIEACEAQFKVALETFQAEESLLSVQCLTLATLYFMMKADYASMLRYKGHAIGLSQRLGLHQTQKRYTFDALTIETRKRVFWSLFTLDCFSAAHLGLPTLLSNANVHCEYPVDADDEYVTEKGFLPTLPGKSTELSSALALFKLSRVLSKILEELYPASPSYELSFRKIAALQDELDNWSTELAPHLRLHFEKDKPSTRIVSDRSPLISLAYQYTHTLISRPAILATASSQARSTPSILSLASSSKRIIQIVELLQERNMAFAFCLDENEILLQAALGLLFETLELGSDSAVHKDNARLVGIVLEKLETNSIPGHSEFRKFLDILFRDNAPRLQRHGSNESKTDKNQRPKHSQKRALKAFASRLTGSSDKNSDGTRRGTYPYMSPQQSSTHGQNNDVTMNVHQTPMFARSEPALSPPQAYSTILGRQSKRNLPPGSIANGSMLSLGISGMPLALANNDDASSPADWERLLSNLDNGQSTIWDGIYGSGPGVQQRQPPSLGDYSSLASGSPKGLMSSNIGSGLSGAEHLGPRSSWSPLNSWAIIPDLNAQNVNIPQSVMSFTSDETPNMDDFAELGFSAQAPDNGFGKAIVIPGVGSPTTMSASNDVDLFAGLDLNFGT